MGNVARSLMMSTIIITVLILSIIFITDDLSSNEKLITAHDSTFSTPNHCAMTYFHQDITSLDSSFQDGLLYEVNEFNLDSPVLPALHELVISPENIKNRTQSKNADKILLPSHPLDQAQHLVFFIPGNAGSQWQGRSFVSKLDAFLTTAVQNFDSQHLNQSPTASATNMNDLPPKLSLLFNLLSLSKTKFNPKSKSYGKYKKINAIHVNSIDGSQSTVKEDTLYDFSRDLLNTFDFSVITEYISQQLPQSKHSQKSPDYLFHSNYIDTHVFAFNFNEQLSAFSGISLYQQEMYVIDNITSITRRYLQLYPTTSPISISIIGHSMGGVITLSAVEKLAKIFKNYHKIEEITLKPGEAAESTSLSSSFKNRVSIANVVTIGTPIIPLYIPDFKTIQIYNEVAQFTSKHELCHDSHLKKIQNTTSDIPINPTDDLLCNISLVHIDGGNGDELIPLTYTASHIYNGYNNSLLISLPQISSIQAHSDHAALMYCGQLMDLLSTIIMRKVIVDNMVIYAVNNDKLTHHNEKLTQITIPPNIIAQGYTAQRKFENRHITTTIKTSNNLNLSARPIPVNTTIHFSTTFGDINTHIFNKYNHYVNNGNINYNPVAYPFYSTSIPLANIVAPGSDFQSHILTVSSMIPISLQFCKKSGVKTACDGAIDINPSEYLSILPQPALKYINPQSGHTLTSAATQLDPFGFDFDEKIMNLYLSRNSRANMRRQSTSQPQSASDQKEYDQNTIMGSNNYVYVIDLGAFYSQKIANISHNITFETFMHSFLLQYTISPVVLEGINNLPRIITNANSVDLTPNNHAVFASQYTSADIPLVWGSISTVPKITRTSAANFVVKSTYGEKALSTKQCIFVNTMAAMQFALSMQSIFFKIDLIGRVIVQFDAETNTVFGKNNGYKQCSSVFSPSQLSSNLAPTLSGNIISLPLTFKTLTVQPLEEGQKQQNFLYSGRALNLFSAKTTSLSNHTFFAPQNEATSVDMSSLHSVGIISIPKFVFQSVFDDNLVIPPQIVSLFSPLEQNIANDSNLVYVPVLLPYTRETLNLSFNALQSVDNTTNVDVVNVQYYLDAFYASIRNATIFATMNMFSLITLSFQMVFVALLIKLFLLHNQRRFFSVMLDEIDDQNSESNLNPHHTDFSTYKINKKLSKCRSIVAMFAKLFIAFVFAIGFITVFVLPQLFANNNVIKMKVHALATNNPQIALVYSTITTLQVNMITPMLTRPLTHLSLFLTHITKSLRYQQFITTVLPPITDVVGHYTRRLVNNAFIEKIVYTFAHRASPVSQMADALMADSQSLATQNLLPNYSQFDHLLSVFMYYILAITLAHVVYGILVAVFSFLTTLTHFVAAPIFQFSYNPHQATGCLPKVKNAINILRNIGVNYITPVIMFCSVFIPLILLIVNATFIFIIVYFGPHAFGGNHALLTHNYAIINTIIIGYTQYVYCPLKQFNYYLLSTIAQHLMRFCDIGSDLTPTALTHLSLPHQLIHELWLLTKQAQSNNFKCVIHQNDYALLPLPISTTTIIMVTFITTLIFLCLMYNITMSSYYHYYYHVIYKTYSKQQIALYIQQNSLQTQNQDVSKNEKNALDQDDDEENILYKLLLLDYHKSISNAKFLYKLLFFIAICTIFFILPSTFGTSNITRYNQRFVPLQDYTLEYREFGQFYDFYPDHNATFAHIREKDAKYSLDQYSQFINRITSGSALQSNINQIKNTNSKFSYDGVNISYDEYITLTHSGDDINSLSVMYLLLNIDKRNVKFSLTPRYNPQHQSVPALSYYTSSGAWYRTVPTSLMIKLNMYTVLVYLVLLMINLFVVIYYFVSIPYIKQRSLDIILTLFSSSHLCNVMYSKHFNLIYNNVTTQNVHNKMPSESKYLFSLTDLLTTTYYQMFDNSYSESGTQHTSVVVLLKLLSLYSFNILYYIIITIIYVIVTMVLAPTFLPNIFDEMNDTILRPVTNAINPVPANNSADTVFPLTKTLSNPNVYQFGLFKVSKSFYDNASPLSIVYNNARSVGNTVTNFVTHITTEVYTQMSQQTLLTMIYVIMLMIILLTTTLDYKLVKQNQTQKKHKKYAD